MASHPPFGTLRKLRRLSGLRLLVLGAVKAQIALGARTDVAIVLGAGKLMAYLERLNAEHGLFKKLVALEHPRFIMQYRRKRIPEFVEKYKNVLGEALAG